MNYAQERRELLIRNLRSGESGGSVGGDTVFGNSSWAAVLFLDDTQAGEIFRRVAA